jgi:hypothetical protein
LLGKFFRPVVSNPDEQNSEDPEEVAKNRKEFEKVAEKLKASIKTKDKTWLRNLVNSKTGRASKRILMSKLLEENHASISRELAAIRFAKKKTKSTEMDIFATMDNLDGTMLTEVDFSDLPDELFTQIENFIKIEHPEVVQDEDDDEIIEIPVPEKPPTEIVTLDDNETENSRTSINPQIATTATSDDQESSNFHRPVENNKNNPFEVLKILTDEEATLFGKLRTMDEEKNQIMARLDYLRELRSEILSNKQD